MQQIKNTSDIKQLGTILSVWAHPDDESFSCAGIMAAAVKNGQKVICITANRGELGVQDEKRWPANRLAQIREEEMDQALEILGVKEHIWLDYTDGKCQNTPLLEGASRIVSAIKQHRPDAILTFGPDGMTGHPDHQSVSRWVTEAVKGKEIKVYHTVEEKDRYNRFMVEADKKFDIYFNIDKPPVFVESRCDIAYSLSPEILFQKRLALKAMPSQTERMFKNTASDMMNAMLAQECFVLA